GVAAAAPSNTAGEQRKHGGCTWTQNSANDLVVAAPAPRNSASPVHSCVPGPLDHVTITGSLSVLAGATTQLTADAVDVNENSVPGATVTWVTSDAATATVNATGLVTGVANTGHAATITATAVSGAITKAASVDVQVSTPGGINWVDISSSSSSFPPGFQTELFATARESDGGTIIPATFTFEAVNPDIATVATVANTGSATGTTAGIVTGVHAPTDGSKPGIRVTATPLAGGTPYSFVTHPITIEVPITAPPSIYAVNDEFGDPTPAATDHPDDMLIRRNQYVLSYNQSRGTPNWVSYELDARQLVAGADRCNCFAADPLLPVSKQILTSDYTNGGYDRGHMTRSADRTQANVDNAITFYLTNVVPQFGALNQGVWAQFENMLADSARAGKAVYIITGPLYSRSHTLTFLKGEGKVAIPDSTWKVALIGPGNGGNPFTHNSIQSYEDLIDYTLLAVNMRNHDTVGLRNTPPLTFQTTVDKIEQATGYDILSLLGAGKQGALDYHDRKPVASFSTSGALAEGSPVTFDASASSDPDIGRMDMDRTEALTYSWAFSDGTTATGAVVTKTFANDGAYSATLTVTDAFGWPASTSGSVAIANVAPDIAAFAGATLLPGETYSASGSFADPGADVWTATADYGDGSGAQVLSLSSQSFALSHTYAAAGTFTVTISVSDGLATTTRTQTVLVKTSAQGLQDIEATIDQLVAGGALNSGNGNSLSSKLDAAVKQLQKGNSTPARNQLNAVLNEIDAMLQSGRLSPTDAATLRAAIERVLRSF
ncbi:MAG TPA: DNA/RNA non-specific endonuclease, partial [Gemmatimonadaceae bacterium]